MRNHWSAPPQQLRLGPGEVHVWRAKFQAGEVAAAELARLGGILPDERRRASHYRNMNDGLEFLLGRAVLRHILSSYLGAHPAALSFSYSAHGKPSLANPGAEWLRFNISHSRALVLCAVACDRAVGIDVEQIRSDVATWQLATAFFAAGEIEKLRRLGEELGSEAFFSCWTRKEAYLKAKGSGLSAWLDSFEVPVDPDAGFDQLAPVMTDEGDWSLQSLDAGEQLAAACVAEGRDWTLKLWDWNAAGQLRSQAA